MSIKLYICLPDRVLNEKQADKVILPLENKTLTLIDGRAPTIQPLATGAVILLDEHNQAYQRYFIDGGFANIENNVCRLATTKLVDTDNQEELSHILKNTENSAFATALQDYIKAFK